MTRVRRRPKVCKRLRTGRQMEKRSFCSHHVPSCVFYPRLWLDAPLHSLLFVHADCYQWITHNKQGIISHFLCSSQVESVTYSYNLIFHSRK
ncbi:hypothetical protein Y032_0270g854 [Ancylostoma ceylanicum]|uniref:Uncharacterized protein n=1 Tax=Ancylostoma ceylanicum TaxID=53326 RepID=A0A016S963_9BILA|nr:hypothetical protein Y032_0270g854 [Ancylostoma ceylanicum]